MYWVEIGDFGSRERAEVVRRDDGSWLVDAHLSIHEAATHLERSDLAGDGSYHTVAGFVLWHLGRLPSEGERLRWRDLEIAVIGMDGACIDKVLVKRRTVGTSTSTELGSLEVRHDKPTRNRGSRGRSSAS